MKTLLHIHRPISTATRHHFCRVLFPGPHLAVLRGNSTCCPRFASRGAQGAVVLSIEWGPCAREQELQSFESCLQPDDVNLLNN